MLSSYLIFTILCATDLFDCQRSAQLMILCVNQSHSQTNDHGLWSVHMHTKLENGFLRNEQQPNAVDNFINQSEIEAVRLLSGCKSSCCDKHQFHANEYLNSFRDINVEHSGLNIDINDTFTIPHS